MAEFTAAALPVVMSGVKQHSAMAQQRAAVRAQNAHTNRLIAVEKRRRAAAEREKKKQLKHAKAAQRARFGASGLSAAQGSARAVLRGLERSADDRMADARFESDLRLQGLESRRKNLLDTSGAFSRITFKDWEKHLPKKGGGLFG